MFTGGYLRMKKKQNSWLNQEKIKPSDYTPPCGVYSNLLPHQQKKRDAWLERNAWWERDACVDVTHDENLMHNVIK